MIFRLLFLLPVCWFFNSSSSLSSTVTLPGDTLHYPEEKHFRNLIQLTNGGDNAEAYFSFDGRFIVFQKTNPKEGIACEVGRAFYRNSARGQIIGDTKGLLKLVFDPESLKLLGVHMVGDIAAELLHIGMMVMQVGGTINAFIDGVFNYPTLSDAYKYAAYDGLGAVARKEHK